MRAGRRAVGAGTMAGLAILGATAASAVPAAAQGSGGGGLGTPPEVRTISCPSPALGGSLPARVYLPAGYSATGPGYRVVYFLHGLPAGPQTYSDNSYVATALAAENEPAIVVAPQGARHANSDPEYLDWRANDDWPRAIAVDLTSCVDRRFNTIANRDGRALVGQSAGGFGALNIGLRNLQTFGAVEAWSGYFAATDPSGAHALRFRSAIAQAAATVPSRRTLSAAMAASPSLLGFYVGRSDPRFARVNEQFNAGLTADHIPHVYRTYPGGHSRALWQARAAGWLKMALVYLSTGRATDP